MMEKLAAFHNHAWSQKFYQGVAQLQEGANEKNKQIIIHDFTV